MVKVWWFCFKWFQKSLKKKILGSFFKSTESLMQLLEAILELTLGLQSFLTYKWYFYSEKSIP